MGEPRVTAKQRTRAEPVDNPQAPLEVETSFLRRSRAAREEAGMSQRELSRRLGRAGLPMHQSSVAKLERDDEDRRPLRLAEAVALSQILGVPVFDVDQRVEPVTYRVTCYPTGDLAWERFTT